MERDTGLDVSALKCKDGQKVMQGTVEELVALPQVEADGVGGADGWGWGAGLKTGVMSPQSQEKLRILPEQLHGLGLGPRA